ncbi:glucokinase, putative [Entamoeba dispar SAW760]|uniref:Phosphotransferase n=1 Tax=Entamoeba dispar (strain ATCC PRA-260 / SAW760) TaxID=370354 RepID=B0EI94_ENTDS|nr:glucokinase, putative [Entamoeba dispar SAW760]EDR25742.1 glucokinase, putative [Entamoeba dispar SAW760]|eukprot:EDR25742.1 glucokinase, putative [Entamoeba dispar SAW760]
MQEIIDQFAIDKEKLEIIVQRMSEELTNGLQDKPSTLKMLPSYAPIPTGKEVGTFMGIDVGGTNLRVLLLEIPEPGVRGELKSVECIMPKTSTTIDQFFGFIAQKIKEFVENNNLKEKEIKAGLTFSFAVEQIAIDKGIQQSWSKGWDIKESIGKDIVEIFHNQLAKVNVKNIRIVAFINDTVGTFANLAYDDASCGMGLIFGTGTNGCYIEKTSNFASSKLKSVCKEDYMIVNTEWGALDIPELGYNRFDKMIDDVSVNKGEHYFEKMISGIYMGWLARLAIRELIEKKVIFERYANADVFSNSPDDTDCDHSKKYTSRHTGIVEDTTPELILVDEMLKSLGVNDSTLEERKILKNITEAVVKRAAYLAAAATVCLYRKMVPYMKERTTAGVDGSVFEKSVPFKKFYLEALDLLQPVEKVTCQLSKDGSGLGAVIVAAAVACKQ